MSEKEPEKLATVELCAHVWVVVVGDSRIGPVYVESEANDIAESINSTASASIRQAVNAKLEEAAKIVDGMRKNQCTIPESIADEIRKLKED